MKPTGLLIATAAAVVAALRRRPFLSMVSTRVGAGDLGMNTFQGKFNAMPGTVQAPPSIQGNSGSYGMRAVVANAGTVSALVPGTAFGSTEAGFTEYVWNFIWNHVDLVYKDNDAARFFSAGLMDSMSFKTQVEAICDDIEREAIRAWLRGAVQFQAVGTNGFADSDANFESEWDTGLAVKLADAGAVGDLYGLINPTDHGNLKGVTGVRAADTRGDMEAAKRFDVQLFDGVMWLMCNNIPKMADSFSGSILVNGAITAGDTSFAFDGGGTLKPGAIITFGTDTSRFLVTHVDGATAHVDTALEATANNTAVNGINDQISLVFSKRCVGHAPALIIPDASDPDYVVAQDMGDANAPGTGCGVSIERNRATKGQSNYVFAGAQAAGPIDGNGIGVLVPR